MNTNNDVKWRRFIVPKKVEQINDHLFIDTYLYDQLLINGFVHNQFFIAFLALIGLIWVIYVHDIEYTLNR